MIEAQSDLVVREALHRVGNELALACAALRLARLRGANDPVVVAAEARIAAAAEINGVLCRRAGCGMIDLASYLARLHDPIGRLAASEGAAVVFSSVPVSVRTADAVRVGMIVTELVANSVRHARRDGEAIAVDLSNGPAGPTITVQDGGGDGVWMREDGQGGGLVDALATALRGGVDRFATADRRGEVRVWLPTPDGADEAYDRGSSGLPHDVRVELVDDRPFASGCLRAR
jgi:two-component sensor histidine kinase